MSDETAPQPTPVFELRDAAVAAIRDPGLIHTRGMNWSVLPGEFWVLAGLQGTGKTDLLMMLGGLLPPAAGLCRWFGSEQPLGDEARLPDRLRVGLVFETGQLLHHLTVRENLALPIRYHRNLAAGAAEGEVQRLLEALDLVPYADRSPGGLPRNWQKRAGLARALALKPDVLLVDSPLAGLDLKHSYWWIHLLGRLFTGDPLLDRKPLTIVATAADLRPWRRVARQCALLANGSLVVLGNWSELNEAQNPIPGDLLENLAEDGREPGKQ